MIPKKSTLFRVKDKHEINSLVLTNKFFNNTNELFWRKPNWTVEQSHKFETCKCVISKDEIEMSIQQRFKPNRRIKKE